MRDSTGLVLLTSSTGSSRRKLSGTLKSLIHFKGGDISVVDEVSLWSMFWKECFIMSKAKFPKVMARFNAWNGSDQSGVKSAGSVQQVLGITKGARIAYAECGQCSNGPCNSACAGVCTEGS